MYPSSTVNSYVVVVNRAEMDTSCMISNTAGMMECYIMYPSQHPYLRRSCS